MSPYRVSRASLGDDPVWNAVERMWDAVRIDEASLYDETVRLASPGQQALYSYFCYVGQVDNGGHEQFFFNQTGIVWRELIAGYRLLNALEHERVAESAISLFPNAEPSKDQETRRWQLENLVKPDELNRLDLELDELEEDFISLAKRHMDRFPSEYFTD